MLTSGARSVVLQHVQHNMLGSRGCVRVTKASVYTWRCRATQSGRRRLVLCEASRRHQKARHVPDSNPGTVQQSLNETAASDNTGRRQRNTTQQSKQQQHSEDSDNQHQHNRAAAASSAGSRTAAAQRTASTTSSNPTLDPTIQPVSLLIVEIIAPSYAIARMVRVLNDDAQLTFTRVAAYAAVELNPWIHQNRSFNDPSTMKIPDSSYTNICGSIRDQAVQQQLRRMIQQQLERSADEYSSKGSRIDGVLVFAAPPSTSYSMPIWHLPRMFAEDSEQTPEWVHDISNRLFDADRIVTAILQTYDSIKAVCAQVQHPVTCSPVPCGLILQNDWVDLQQQRPGAAEALGSSRSTAAGSSSRRRGMRTSSSGEATSPEPQQQQQQQQQQRLPVILGLHNRPFIQPYLSGAVTHGPFHVVKHYWCTDGHLNRHVTPSVVITDVTGITGNKCWCGTCDTPPWELDDEEKQQIMQRDSRYQQPKITAAAAEGRGDGGTRRLQRMGHIQGQQTTERSSDRQAGQQPPRSVWPEAFVMTAVMTFRRRVAQQLIAAAAASSGEASTAADILQSAAADAAAARGDMTSQLAAANSRPRGNRRKRSSSGSSMVDLAVQTGQTVSERRQQLLQRSVTVRGSLWPLLDGYNIAFRKKANKAELVENVINHERQQGLLVEAEQQQQEQ